MKSEFRSELITKEILGSKFCEFMEIFIYYSERLGREIIIPIGFICDYESVPLIKATSKRGGAIHDYLCRIDSDPVVTKQMAASVYLEAQNCRDQMILSEERKGWKDKNIFEKTWFQMGRFNKWVRRNVKTFVVRIVSGYFHKLTVGATLQEVRDKL